MEVFGYSEVDEYNKMMINSEKIPMEQNSFEAFLIPPSSTYAQNIGSKLLIRTVAVKC